MGSPQNVTLVKNAIHRSDEPRHFMRIKPVKRRVTATCGNELLANSRQSVKLQEAGMDLYEPVYYFPREDVAMAHLSKSDHTTHCPLKGDTVYYHLEANGRKLENAAWTYAKPNEHGKELQGKIAFDSKFIQIIEHVDQ